MGRTCCAECAGKDVEPTRPPAPCPSQEPHQQRASGNQELLRLARSGQAFRATVGAADDPAERAADAMADQVLAGQGSGAAVVRRSSPGGGGPGALGAALGSPGRTLDPTTASRMERGFGTDLSGVRVHDTAAAGASAVGIGAQAYTLGTDVVFAPGRYAPGTDGGLRLLAHELGHVVQQSAAPGPVRRATTTAAPPAAPAPAAQLDTDVCLVDVTLLTNDALIAQTGRVQAYLGARRRGEDDYYAYDNLRRRLDDERHRRMRMGHLYLAAASSAFPSELYRLDQRGADLFVYRQETGPLHGLPAQLVGHVVTESQFNATLTELNIPQVDLREHLAALRDPLDPVVQLLMPARPAPPELLPWPWYGAQDPADALGVGQLGPWGGLPGSPWTSATIGAGYLGSLRGRTAAATLGAPITFDPAVAGSRSGALVNYRGHVAETLYSSDSLLRTITQEDLNAIKNNFEVFDFGNRWTGDFDSVSSTLRTLPQATGPWLGGPIDTRPNWSTYDSKFAKAFGQVEAAKFAVATAELNQAHGTTLTTQDVAARAQLVVNADHVAAFRQRVRGRLPDNPGRYAVHIDAVLRDAPLAVKTTANSTLAIAGWNDLQAAFPQLDQATYQGCLDQAADRVAARIVEGALTEHLARLTSFREYTMQLGITTPEAFRAQATPELVEAIRYGGHAKGAARAGLRGGAVGGGLGTAFDIYNMATDPYRHPYWYPEIMFRGGLQFAGGFAGQAAESAIVSAANVRLLVQPGITFSAGRAGARALGGAGPALVIAPAVTTGTMALEELFTDAYYTRIDYAAAAARSTVAGAGGALAGVGGGALGAALVGASAGSVAPVVGTAIGLVVGFLGYLVVDKLLGDDIEQSVRLSMGEAGCPRPLRPTTTTSPWDHVNWSCFPAGTRIRLADGTACPVERLRRGVEVVAVDVVRRTLVRQVVEQVTAHPATVVLALLLSDGTLLRTTSGHPLFDGIGWRPAGELAVGDRVYVVPDASPDSEPMCPVAVRAITLSPAEPVYDVTTSGVHTYLAEGVVVHNKNI